MPHELPDDFTLILNSAAKGNPDAAEQAWCTVYGHLHAVARQTLGTPRLGERQVPGPTTVVHSAFMGALTGSEGNGQPDWADRKEFFLAVAKRMIGFLVKHRADNPQLVRGGFARILPLQTNFDTIAQFDAALAATDAGVFASLGRLEADHRKASEVVWLRYVCGLTIEQTAELLEVKPRTVCKHWNYARAWLRRDLERELKRKLPKAV